MAPKMKDIPDNWHTSTPVQCRHDSGYIRYSMYNGILELSPIRKQSSNIKQNPGKINPKKLTFLSLCSGFEGDSYSSDSGIASSINDSVSDSDSLTNKKTQSVTDANCNFMFPYNSSTGNEPYQPSKYIRKDHSITFAKSNRNDVSEIFRGYAISSDSFKSMMKNSKIDFLYELDLRNCTSIISDILSNLTDEDLRQANNVSKRWQDIVSSDKKANNRRILYINNKKNAARGPNKENKVNVVTPAQRDHKSAFSSLANVESDKQPLTFDTIQGRFDSFIQELKIGGNLQTIMKCPKCRYPARADTKLKYCCTRNLCKHEFCKKCLGPFLDNHKCSVPELNDPLSDVIVGSKKSRKSLRRLKA